VKRFPPSVLSKVTTVFQVTAVAVVLLSGLLHDLEPVVLVMVYLVAGLTLASGLDYVWRVHRRLVGERDKE
jgi:phosphatidylglycerophosphate synthase